MSTQHTPGPWAVGTDTARDAAPGRVHVLAQSITTSGLETVAVASTENNARLIAAAPELLDALIDCADTLAVLALIDEPALVAARAAIAKAVQS
jgi:hypothetical protein